MKHDIIDTIENIENEDIKIITKTLVEKYKDKFKNYPAAKSFNHAKKS